MDQSQLEGIELFQGLSSTELAMIAGLVHRRKVAAGTQLISAEQPGEVVYVVLSGTVKIHVEQRDGTDVVIALLGAGDVVGEMSLLDSAGRSANVVTQEASTLAWMQNSDFQHCIRTIPAITYNLVRTLTGRLRLANEQIQALASLDVSGRVARQILAFSQRYGQVNSDGSIRIPIRLTQSDLAGLVGASRERVNQAIVSFKQRGILSINQRYHITILQREILAKACA